MAFDIEQFPTSKEAKRMLTFVTRDFYDRSYVGKWLFQVMGLEMDEMRGYLDELTLQIFPETATWGLQYHEEKWGLPVYSGNNYEERRRAILAKRDYRAPMMPYRMEQYLQDMTENYTVRIADIHDEGPSGWTAPHPNTFKAFFIGNGDDAGTINVNEIKKLLDRIKQSHTTYTMAQEIDIEIDNTDLEQIRVPLILMHIDIPYRSNIVLDGDWQLDGQFLLNQGLGSRIGLGIRNRIKTYQPDEIMCIPEIRIGATARTESQVKAKETTSLTIAFWDARLLDGLWLLDGSHDLGSTRRYGMHIKDTSRAGINSQTEQIANVAVTRHTSDYWFFDGGLSLDGARHLNSIYEKEEIE